MDHPHHFAVFESISSTIAGVLLINPSANVFVFSDFSICCKGWLTYLGGTDRPQSQTTLLRWLTFILRSLTVAVTVLLFWIYLFLLVLVFILQWLSLHWEILIFFLCQFPLTFIKLKAGWPVSLLALWLFYLVTIYVLIGFVFVIIWDMFHGRRFLVYLWLLVSFVSWFRLELMYIYLILSIRSKLTHLYVFQQLVLP